MSTNNTAGTAPVKAGDSNRLTGKGTDGPLSEAGAGGVTAAINDMTAKLAGAMARTASSDISHIDPALVWHKGSGRRACE